MNDLEHRDDEVAEEEAVEETVDPHNGVGPGRHQVLPERAGPENFRDTPTAPVPPAHDQPGIGRAANPDRSPHAPQPANRSVSRVGQKVEEVSERRQAAREASVERD